MININSDKERNLLTIELTGFHTEEELKVGVDRVIALARELKPGYTIINDIRRFHPATPEGADEIKRAQLFVIQNGAGKIIRVTEHPISRKQLDRTSQEVGYEAYDVSSWEEAFKLLD